MSKNAETLLDKIIIGFNLPLVRLDAFLNNYIELAFIGTFLVLFHRFTEVEAQTPLDLVLTLNALIVVTHYVYSIVYVINDYIDFNEVQKLKANKDLFSFYALRPVIYYNKSLKVFTCYVAFYAFLVASSTILVGWWMLTYYLAFPIIAIVHSKARKCRLVTFMGLRSLKYLLFYSLLRQFLLHTLSAYGDIAFLVFVVPLLFYDSITYIRSKARLFEFILPWNIKLKAIHVVLGLGTIIVMVVAFLSMLVPFIKSTLCISPLYIARELLRLKLGETNPNLYVHLKRLLILFTVTFLISLTLILLV